MSKSSREKWRKASESWPELWQFLAGHFHEDTQVMWGSDENALAAGIGELSTGRLREILKEWRSWNNEIGWKDDEIVRFVQVGFNVNRVFKDALHARTFMNSIYDAMIAAVRSRTGDRWKP